MTVAGDDGRNRIGARIVPGGQHQMIAEKPQQRSPGIVWVWMGCFGLAATLLSSLGVLLHLGKGDAVMVLAVGGFLSSLLFLVALGRGIHARRKGADPKSTPLQLGSTATLRFALAGLLCIAVGVGILGSVRYYRVHQDAECLSEAQTRVEASFEKNPHPKLGAFQRMTGEGYSYPVWNIQGYHYLTANRTAHFTQGSVPVRMYVTEGQKTARGVEGVGTPKVELGDPNIVYVYISHSKLKE